MLDGSSSWVKKLCLNALTPIVARDADRSRDAIWFQANAEAPMDCTDGGIASDVISFASKADLPNVSTDGGILTERIALFANEDSPILLTVVGSVSASRELLEKVYGLILGRRLGRMTE